MWIPKEINLAHLGLSLNFIAPHSLSLLEEVSQRYNVCYVWIEMFEED